MTKTNNITQGEIILRNISNDIQATRFFTSQIIDTLETETLDTEQKHAIAMKLLHRIQETLGKYGE